jgi:hypothetical protein
MFVRFDATPGRRRPFWLGGDLSHSLTYGDES